MNPSDLENDTYDLSRFLRAQHHDYAVAISEIREGQKRSHWMWYIFPQYVPFAPDPPEEDTQGEHRNPL